MLQGSLQTGQWNVIERSFAIESSIYLCLSMKILQHTGQHTKKPTRMPWLFMTHVLQVLEVFHIVIYISVVYSIPITTTVPIQNFLGWLSQLDICDRLSVINLQPGESS